MCKRQTDSAVISEAQTVAEDATYDVLGIPVSATTLSRASARIHAWAHDGQGRMVFIRDIHGVMQAQRNPELMRLHQMAAMVTPDGMPLVWVGKLRHQDVDRTCGPDLMERVFADSAQTGLRHYLYGGKPGVAQKLKEVFKSKYPSVNVVGCDTPPFHPLSEDELATVAEQINRSCADVVWIGISTPKQELLMHDLLPRLHCTLIGVGAAYDFLIGLIKRAPGWMQRSGLEWLWRLAYEPKRLWRRYLILAPQFVWLVFRVSLVKSLSRH
jgi:N-acetylglucosaminyldiphosphoundecaprenol N-acetyl-beta-D-mannosaminyltransferase